MTWTVDDAKAFAIKAHRSIGQLRPYSGEPYEVHPEEVAKLVESVPHTKAMVAAAWLHDTKDDVPGVTIEGLADAFDDEVAGIVDDLSDHEKGTGSRAQRKAAERARIALAGAASQTVRLADVISNTRTIVAQNPSFARTYVPEKAALVEVLTKGDPTLRALARKTVDEALAALAQLASDEAGHG
jgi:(p)ppGpp synthase/HD superfamily hydrolase